MYTSLILSLIAMNATASSATPSFTLDPLPYAADTLEPVIDTKTMEIHHGKHHRAYVDNLNGLVADQPELAGMDLIELQKQISRFPVPVRNNGGGHYNHTLYWQLMTTPGTGGEPNQALAHLIAKQYGSLEALQQAFNTAGTKRFGSGWVWLIVTADGELKITSTANQDNPLMDVVPEAERGFPLLGNDVWEHAYYLNYQNRRADFLAAWWRVVNWNVVNERYNSTLPTE